MRIILVRFKNLNSLVGEWEIDLTHPAFVSNGIFAITGPTGAGKTTILDAICLALYGRTPRLSKVTKSGNEIMSRQTGECFAEVTFETPTGRFRCHWSQHRARKKPEGELQAPRHEIADAQSGKVFEATIRGVADRIEEATGMDFDQFTRSMLLAQGGFAAFLQASPDERAPILEQITGTDIYSRISIRVHERRSEERKKFETLSAELAGIQILSDEDEQQLTIDLNQRRHRESEVSKQIEHDNQAVKWLEDLARLEQDLKGIAAQTIDCAKRQEAFQPERRKLERAVNALELSGGYAGLKLIRRDRETNRIRIVQGREKFPAHEAEIKHAEEARKLIEESLAKKKIMQKENQPIIRKARELDIKLQAKDDSIKEQVKVIAEKEKALTSLRVGNDKDIRTLAEEKKVLEDVRTLLAATKTDETLVAELTGICSRFNRLGDLNEQQSAKFKEVTSAEKQVAKAVRIFKERSEHLKAKQDEFKVKKTTLGQKQSEYKTLLEGLSPADWRNQWSVLKDRKALLDEVSEAVRSLADSRRNLEELATRQRMLDVEQKDLAKQLQQQVEKQSGRERERNLLETQLTLIKKIVGFEEARRQLRDGEACPLCGAREHPFAVGNIPAPDETVATLDRVRDAMKKAGESISDIRVKQAETSKDLEQTGIRLKEISEKSVRLKAVVEAGRMGLSINEAEPDWAEVLPVLQKETKDSLDKTAKVAQSAEALEKDINVLRESLDQLKTMVEQAESETRDAAHKKDTTDQAREWAKKQSDVIADQYQKALQEIRREVSIYGIESLSVKELDLIQRDLTNRRDQWRARQKRESETGQAIAALEIRIHHQEEQIKTSDTEIGRQRGALAVMQLERDGLWRERHELFGDKNPDDEESRLISAVEEEEKCLIEADRILNAKIQELSKLKNLVEELEKYLAAKADEHKTAEAAFIAQLNVFGFKNEADYIGACLPEDERKKLMEQARSLTDEQNELINRERDKITQLEIERKRQVTDRPRDEIVLEISRLTDEQKTIQQEIGGIRQKLTDNALLKQKQQDRIKAIEAQKRECSRWDLLHELIGSADGKKFRNFAQGLTFEMMVGQANRQLQKMTDRYLLIRDEIHPLELNVIDNYQAGEIRSTKNLSGGESFIVSLSLALGLSQMASRNVRVDSLFLDEGFGTLDEEALDTALETLAGLRQDGKLIGLISHVPVLTERIGTRIQVTPQTGGRSVIQGPGCRHLN